MPEAAKSGAQASWNPANLCETDEVVLASCPIRRRIVSVCERDHRAIYRFGRAGRVELSANVMYLAHQMYSGGGESQIVVTRGAYQYVLYDRTIRTGFGGDGRNDPTFSSGLMVLKNGLHLANLVCATRSKDMIDANSATRFMPAGALVLHPGIDSRQLPYNKSW